MSTAQNEIRYGPQREPDYGEDVLGLSIERERSEMPQEWTPERIVGYLNGGDLDAVLPVFGGAMQLAKDFNVALAAVINDISQRCSRQLAAEREKAYRLGCEETAKGRDESTKQKLAVEREKAQRLVEALKRIDSEPFQYHAQEKSTIARAALADYEKDRGTA
jgi:hypothetical protein